ncbi:MAG: fumarylacetoacetate hydrolase family protein [Lautropia sp.]|nr:fumarylacetoacetate hydrolase family protein [Lautropia sp.]
MKLATRRDDSRDGQLVVVSRDLKLAVIAEQVTGTLQRALDDWAFMAPQLQDLYDRLNQGRIPNSFPFVPSEYLAPLPRTFQQVSTSAYPVYWQRLQQAGLMTGMAVPATEAAHLTLIPSASSGLLPPVGTVSLRHPDRMAGHAGGQASVSADAPEGEDAPHPQGSPRPATTASTGEQTVAPAETALGGLDFSAQLVAVCDDLPPDLTEASADRHLLLLGLANGWRVHKAGQPTDLGQDYGLAAAPVLVTPDELGDAFRDGRIHRPLHCRVNGRSTGRLDAATDMHHDFRQLMLALARQVRVRAGCVISTGPISNANPDSGWNSIVEARARRRLEGPSHNHAEGPAFMLPGDRIHIDMTDARGQSLFGALTHQVVS